MFQQNTFPRSYNIHGGQESRRSAVYLRYGVQKTAEKSATMVFNFKEGLLYYKLRFSDLSARALKFYEILYFACLIFKIIMALYLLR